MFVSTKRINEKWEIKDVETCRIIGTVEAMSLHTVRLDPDGNIVGVPTSVWGAELREWVFAERLAGAIGVGRPFRTAQGGARLHFAPGVGWVGRGGKQHTSGDDVVLMQDGHIFATPSVRRS